MIGLLLKTSQIEEIILGNFERKFCFIALLAIFQSIFWQVTQLAFTCSKLAIKTPKRRQWRRSGVFIVNFGHISHLFLKFLLLTVNMCLAVGYVLTKQTINI